MLVVIRLCVSGYWEQEKNSGQQIAETLPAGKLVGGDAIST
jgi:hypothetical protein